MRDLDGRSDLAIGFDAPPALPPLSSEAELAIFRAVQEALANVIRHAGASRVDARLGVREGYVELEVTDNGAGLPVGARLEQFERAGHMGLAGMRERIVGMGGTVVVGTAPTGGVRLVARIPAARPAQEEGK